MNSIRFNSTVIFVDNFNLMKTFYKNVLQLEIDLDFGTCVTFRGGLTIWKLMEHYPIATRLGKLYDRGGNKNMELCFETEAFEEIVKNMESTDIRFLHNIVEESWGQKTIRIYDPENNLVEIGESIPCFVKRIHNSGLSAEETSQRTSVSLEMVNEIIK